jgi:hypothetical protein
MESAGIQRLGYGDGYGRRLVPSNKGHVQHWTGVSTSLRAAMMEMANSAGSKQAARNSTPEVGQRKALRAATSIEAHRSCPAVWGVGD